MKLVRKKLLALLVCLGLCLVFTNKAEALDAYDMNGDGYRSTRGAPSLTPALTLGAIAIAGIVAVALININGGHSTHNGHNN